MGEGNNGLRAKVPDHSAIRVCLRLAPFLTPALDTESGITSPASLLFSSLRFLICSTAFVSTGDQTTLATLRMVLLKGDFLEISLGKHANSRAVIDAFFEFASSIDEDRRVTASNDLLHIQGNANHSKDMYSVVGIDVALMVEIDENPALDADHLLSKAIWVAPPDRQGDFPEAYIRDAIEKFLNLLTSPNYSFWREWYQGFLDGKPLDWELQRRVALIDDAVWEAGPEAVAKEIEKIRAEFEKEKAHTDSRAPEFEPETVSHLFENRTIISTGLQSLSENITFQFEAFRRETGLNETPEIFQPLEKLPPVLNRISDILLAGDRSAERKQALREEIGRLHARIKELETELATAKGDLETINKSSWKKIAAWTVGSANLFGVLAASVWTVSGDEVGAQKRLETLLEYRAVLMGADDQSPNWD